VPLPRHLESAKLNLNLNLNLKPRRKPTHPISIIITITMFDYDEKAAYEKRCLRRHRKNNSYDSECSYVSSSSSSSRHDIEKYHDDDEAPPPPYTHTFYHTIDDKPLPPLPNTQTRRVRFAVKTNAVNKPLPPLYVFTLPFPFLSFPSLPFLLSHITSSCTVL